MFEGALMPTHWLVILVIVMIIFGAGKLPNVMKDLGTGVREFKKAQSEDDATRTAPPSPAARVAAPVAPAASVVEENRSATSNGVVHTPEVSARA